MEPEVSNSFLGGNWLICDGDSCGSILAADPCILIFGKFDFIFIFNCIFVPCNFDLAASSSCFCLSLQAGFVINAYFEFRVRYCFQSIPRSSICLTSLMENGMVPGACGMNSLERKSGILSCLRFQEAVISSSNFR